jgi:hypothetical protein
MQRDQPAVEVVAGLPPGGEREVAKLERVLSKEFDQSWPVVINFDAPCFSCQLTTDGDF